MKTIAYLRWADPPLWMATLANLLPLLLLCLAIFPPSIFEKLTGRLFALSVVVIILLLWFRWFTPELIYKYKLFIQRQFSTVSLASF